MTPKLQKKMNLKKIHGILSVSQILTNLPWSNVLVLGTSYMLLNDKARHPKNAL